MSDKYEVMISDLSKDIVSTLKKNIKDSKILYEDFIKVQLEFISEQSIIIAEGLRIKEIPQDKLPEYWDVVERSLDSLINTIIHLLVVSLEKIWNEIVTIIWDTVCKVAKLVLPLPKIV